MRTTNRRSYLLYLLFLVGLVAFFWYLSSSRSASGVTYSEMVQMFQAEQVDSFTIQNNVVSMHLKEPQDGRSDVTCSISSFDAFYDDLNELVQKQKAAGVLTDYDYRKDTQPINWVSLLPSLLSVVMVFLGPVFGYGMMFRGLNLFLHLINPLAAMISFLLWERGEALDKGMILWADLPMAVYGVVYLLMVIVLRRWPDFYGFNMSGRWYLSYAGMLAGTALIGAALRMLRKAGRRPRAR